MSLEYVKITSEEKDYTQKNLLESELDLLNIVKRVREYKKLRKEELTLKIMLRTKISEIMNIYAEMDGILPKVELNKKDLEKETILLSEQKDDLTLEEEIETIKKKLSSLKG